MKHDLTTGTWQDDTGCPMSIILAATSDDHEQQQERSQFKNQTKALYQAQRRDNPVVRSLEQPSDTG